MLAGSVVLLAAFTLVLIHSVERAWFKRRIQELARTSVGVEIDYRALRIDGVSGIEIEGFALRSPTEVRPWAPDLLRVGHLEARWSLTSALLGHGPRFGRVAVSDVSLTVVIDEHGRTSFDAIASSPDVAQSPPAPAISFSRRGASLLATAPVIGQLDVDRVTLTLVRTEHGEIVERTELRGISGTLSTGPAEPTGWRVQARLGSPAQPLELALQRVHGGDDDARMARARLWGAFDASPSALAMAADLRMIDQTFAANVSADHWLHAEARLRFDPRAQRTEITVDRTEAGDGAVTAQATIEIPDTGDAIVRRAHGDIDVARLLRWMPEGLVPVTAERAQVRYRVDSLVVGPVMRLPDGGTVSVDADLSNVAIGDAARSLRIAGGELSLHAEAIEEGGVSGRGSVKVAGGQFLVGADRFAARDVVVDFEGQQAADGAMRMGVGVRAAQIEVAGPSSVDARGARVELRVDGLHFDVDQPLVTRGELTLSGDVGSSRIRFPHAPGSHAIADGFKLRAHATLAGHAPYAAELEVPVSRLRVFGRDGALLTDAPARIECTAREIQPDTAHPAASRGVVHAIAGLGDVQAALDVTKGADSIEFALRGAAESFRTARPFLPPALLDKAPWDGIAVKARARGRIQHLFSASPLLIEATEIDVARPAFENIAAQSLSLTLNSQGTALEHHADLDLRAQRLAFDGGTPSDDRLTLSANVDRTRPSLKFQLATEGRAVTNLSGAVSFDASQRALPYEIEGHFAGLAPLSPFAAKVRGLEGFDLSHLEIGLSARGSLLGTIAGIARDGTIALQPDFARTAAVEGTTDVRVAHFRWSKGHTAILTPAIAWHGDLGSAGDRRTLASRVEIGTLHLDIGKNDVDLNGIRDDTNAAFIGNLASPEIEVTQHLSVRAVEQDVVPEYPLANLTLALSADRDPHGGIHISDMRIANGLGGTMLAVSGNVELSETRRTLSVTTSLTQDLARLSTIPERFAGRGKVAVEANLTSPNFAQVQVRATVTGQDVTFTLPRAGIAVNTANGEVPIALALHVGASGVALQHIAARSPYAMLRFADQHPLLNRSGFLSIARLETPHISIAPLVGNLAIEQNVLSLRQFEMGVRGGTITGQCGLDWDGPKSTLELHVRASGVQSSHGEPFDGNIAVAISAGTRSIEGRAEILRLGERHLLDLLDLEDPTHVDPAMNRIRTALNFGYPQSLRLVFDHGFANAHLELGGFARLVSIGDVRGIPMGPIVDKMLAPVLDLPGMREPQ